MFINLLSSITFTNWKMISKNQIMMILTILYFLFLSWKDDKTFHFKKGCLNNAMNLSAEFDQWLTHVNQS
jgi:hypothetical protein